MNQADGRASARFAGEAPGADEDDPQALRARLRKALDEIEAVRREADAAAGAKAEFLARMSHEMRTPLNAVIGLSNLCLGTSLSPKQADYLEKIRSSAFSLLAIVNDVIDYSQFDRGAVELDKAPFSLREVMFGLKGRFSQEAAQKRLAFRATIDERAPAAVTGDRLRLEQLLGHLVSNAIKFTDKGSVDVSARLAGPDGRPGAGARIVFTVADTGVGMDKAALPQLLDSFTQGESYFTREHGSAGVGLAICSQIVRLMGASITIDSEPGKGSVFAVTADFAACDEDGTSRLETPPELQGLNVLVVDDEEVARNLAVEHLRALSMRAVTARSVKSALTVLKNASTPVDLVILDWLMPGKDGMALLAAIREEHFVSKPPVIMISAIPREDLARRAKAEGAAAFLLKPVSSALLLETIKAVMRKSAAPLSAQPSLSAERAGPHLDGASILLVEDNAINQQVAAEMLEHWGARATVAQNGREALEAVAKARFDAVLMDVQMPVMDGLEATRRLRSDPANAALPIIALTAHALAEDRARCLEAGMNDYLTKPIEQDKLLAALSQWIESADGPVPAAGAGTDAAGADSRVFDHESALRRLSGNQELLRHILAEFCETYAGAGREIRAMLEQGEREEAARLAHTVKGVAGNVSAGALFEAARELETCLRQENGGGSAACLPEFERALGGAVAAMGGLCGDQYAAHEDRKEEIPPLTLLLVDDARLNRKIFSGLLKAQGHDVVTAENGMEACGAVFKRRDAQPFDLILMDLEMPLMDGFKAAGVIRGLLKSSVNPPCRPDIPIIALTAHEADEAWPRCREAGMDGCAHKEFDAVELFAELKRIYAGRIEPRRRKNAGAGGVSASEKRRLLELVRVLEGHLESANLDAESALEALRDQAGPELGARLAEVGLALGRFDFSGALAALRAFERELSAR